MIARRLAILEAINDRLDQAGIAPEVELMPSSDPAPGRALHVYDLGQTQTEREGMHNRYRLTVLVEGFATGESSREAHADLMALYAGVIAAIYASPDGLELIDGLAEQIDEGELDISPAANDTAWTQSFRQQFLVFFTTRRGDPTRAD